MLNHPIAGQVLTIHLASWRYLAALTLPPIIFALWGADSIIAALLLLLAGVSHYYCWRLWLDERLFTLLYSSEPQTDDFDMALQQLWGGKPENGRSLDSRWRGSTKLLHRAMCSILLLWLVMVSAPLIDLIWTSGGNI
ncbi:beta-lactamase fold Zn-dependent hydrolase [Yersinia frederiksenii]|uniref:Beta-lactamase fold Zn-dependent hydrolase n=2 Tax=Yersinia frederiksenii TaxID=29484 RepID=A0A380Q0Q4_YERFR|nr:hypothetical protein [Yersinia frederiksenii]KGA48111.1 putative Zn-dependent hydrolases of the beta-lactamase fold protein [Yersinia frederiksenii ATCC 33641]CFQ87482.1 beta-lactamase fold Zn-dependent hydrolase [Yersinia frederiksenii]SUP79333.1 beta-lactamase fold Zn-dependent hydrolase [Yersinia frederiksenii]